MSDINWKESGFETPTPVPENEEQQIEALFELEYGSEVKKKYDRQIRLWGWLGQRRIDQCSVCLLNATAVGCECLKNLILPGIGRFTICDDRKVEVRDLGNNFYLSKDDLGKDRATAAARSLGELNPTVRGNVIIASVEKLITESPEFFSNYQNIIATQLPFSVIEKLSRIVSSHSKNTNKSINLFVIRSLGMCGYLRIYLGSEQHTIIESKLDNPINDLRLSHPWSMLEKFAEIQDLDKMSDLDLSHTPWPVLLLKTARVYKSQHPELTTHIPNTTLVKSELSKILHSLIPSRAMKLFYQGTLKNFEEASSKIFLVCESDENHCFVPEAVLKIIHSPSAKKDNLLLQSSSSSSKFWRMVYGLRRFFENEGKGKYLPCQGRVPDMHCDTSRFIRLQSLYRRRHRDEVAICLNYISELDSKQEEEVIVEKEEEEEDGNIITKDEVSFFCKYGYNLRLVPFNPIHEELSSHDNHTTFDIQEHLKDGLLELHLSAYFYIALRCSDIFQEKYGYIPGSKNDQDDDDDEQKLFSLMFDFLKEKGYEDVMDKDFLMKVAKTFVRFGGCEIHTISSLMGGVLSQELIKCCTLQRIPMNNTWIYNGFDSKSLTMEL